MALPAASADLFPMYAFNAFDPARMVHHPRPRYGARPPEPERFPAELVLRDLGRAHGDAEVPLILARYAAMRAWLLNGDPAEVSLLAHARVTAAAYLDASPEQWPERPLLRRLLEAESCPEPWGLLAQVGGAAEAAGHLDGALAAHQAACAAAVRSQRLDIAAALAGDIAALLSRRGEARGARRWDRVSRRLAREAALPATPTPAQTPPPS
jgi:hypothetical protein